MRRVSFGAIVPGLLAVAPMALAQDPEGTVTLGESEAMFLVGLVVVLLGAVYLLGRGSGQLGGSGRSKATLVLAIVAGVVFLVGFVPRTPSVPIWAVAVICGAIAYRLRST